MSTYGIYRKENDGKRSLIVLHSNFTYAKRDMKRLQDSNLGQLEIVAISK